jgi:hypothetical protein
MQSLQQPPFVDRVRLALAFADATNTSRSAFSADEGA